MYCWFSWSLFKFVVEGRFLADFCLATNGGLLGFGGLVGFMMELAEFFLFLSVLLNWISARRFSSVAFMSLSMRELAFFGQFVRSWFLVVLRF